MLLRLPPGPTLSETAQPIQEASDHAHQYPTMVTINYRLSSPLPFTSTDTLDYRYPSPIHDVCTSFAYLIQTILPELFSQSQEEGEAPAIDIGSSHIGAALATTLALTEPNAISAVRLEDPVVDWCMFDEHAGLHQIIPSKSKKAQLSADPEAIADAARAFIAARTRLFPTPSSYFDPFASPMLFLRAPGQDTPRTHAEALGLVDSPEDEMSVNSSEAIEDEARIYDAFGPYDDDNTSTPSAGSIDINNLSASSPLPSKGQTRRYKVLRRWPPIGRPEDVLLPRFSISSSVPTSSADGRQWLLHKQAAELASYLQRACFWGRERGVAEERVQFHDSVMGK